jgi:hypothetical protein
MALMLPPNDLKLSNNHSTNIILAAKYIVKVNGLQGLYKGLIPAASKAGLGCFIYFALLRTLEKPKQTRAEDFMLSSLARVSSTFFTNALNIVETRCELTHFHKYKTIHGALLDIYQTDGVKGFFSGGLTSCLKEGFFAGLYYMVYEELKKIGLCKFSSGIISGVLATAITHPLELIRAKIQTLEVRPHEGENGHLLNEFRLLRKNREWFKGVAPRLLKKPLSNTMTFLFFELIEEGKRKNLVPN